MFETIFVAWLWNISITIWKTSKKLINPWASMNLENDNNSKFE